MMGAVAYSGCAAAAFVAFLLMLDSPARAQAALVAPGRSVTLEYTVKLDDGTVVDSSDEGGPLTYVQGDGEMLPALEAALSGMAVSERKSIRLEPEDAYGRVDPDAFREVPIDDIPESARRVGATLRARGSGETMRVDEIREKTIVLDYNNPLAGKALTFDVEILSIE